MNNPKAIENLKPFKKGQSGNPKGRPRRLVSHVIRELDEEGVKETTKNEITSCYLRLINLTETELKDKINDESEPVLIKIVGEAILSKKGFDVVESLLNRAIGKPQQTMDIDGRFKFDPEQITGMIIK